LISFSETLVGRLRLYGGNLALISLSFRLLLLFLFNQVEISPFFCICIGYYMEQQDLLLNWFDGVMLLDVAHSYANLQGHH